MQVRKKNKKINEPDDETELSDGTLANWLANTDDITLKHRPLAYYVFILFVLYHSYIFFIMSPY